MIRKFLGLGALVALLGPVSCLSNDGPKPFTTGDTCAAGDVEGCTCQVKGATRLGARGCASDQTFSSSECRCDVGCTIYPDCDRCGDDCMSRCLCHRMGQVEECQALCPDSGK